MKFNLNPKGKKELVTLVIVFLVVLTISAFAVYFIAGRQSVADNSRQVPQAGAAESTLPDRRSASNSAGEENFMDRLFGANRGEIRTNGERWAENVGRISLRLLLATLLGAALAFRPRRRIVVLKRNPYVSQTQIHLAVVAAALMIIEMSCQSKFSRAWPSVMSNSLESVALALGYFCCRARPN